MPDAARSPCRPTPPRARVVRLTAAVCASAAVLTYVLYLFVSQVLAGYTALLALAFLAACGIPADTAPPSG